MYLLIILLVNVFFFNFIVHAEELQTQISDQSIAPQGQTWEETFIESNKAISAWLDSTTEGVDLFLVGKKITKEKNKSVYRFENTTTSIEGKNFSNVFNAIIRPRLSNLEEYLQLQLTSFDETNVNNRGVENRYFRQNRREQNVGASVGFFKKLGQVKTYFQPRIQLSDPLKVSNTLGAQSVVAYKYFQFNPKFEFFTNAERGLGIFQAYNINYQFNRVFSVTLINEAQYEEKFNFFSVTHGVAFGQVLNSKSALTYAFITNSNNKTRYHLEGYNVAVTYNRLIYKNILDYQLTPFLDFNKPRRFKGQIGINFTLGLTF